MQYKVYVLDNTGSSTAALLTHAAVRGWGKKINAPGQMTFSLPIGDTEATAANLQKYRQVELWRQKQDGTAGWEIIWTGYVEADKDNGQYIDVICKGNLGLFKKRLTSLNQPFTGQGSTEAFSLLTTTNGTDGNTGIVTGTGGVTTAKNITTQGRIDILRAWEQLAQADGGEFEIDDTRTFHFKPTLGSDKSGTVTLKFRRDAVPGTNVRLTGRGEDGEPMANRIIGTTTAGTGYTSTKNDATSQLTYPVLIEAKQFNEAQDQAALDAMTQSYLTQRANPVTDYRVVPILASKSFDIASGTRKVSGLQYGDVAIGDLVTCDFVTENQTVQEARRVAEIEVTVDENLQETVLYTLSKSGVFITSSYLEDGQVQELKRRIRELEALV